MNIFLKHRQVQRIVTEDPGHQTEVLKTKIDAITHQSDVMATLPVERVKRKYECAVFWQRLWRWFCHSLWSLPGGRVDLIETQDVIVSAILDPRTQERQDISVSTEPSMGELYELDKRGRKWSGSVFESIIVNGSDTSTNFQQTTQFALFVKLHHSSTIIELITKIKITDIYIFSLLRTGDIYKSYRTHKPIQNFKQLDFFTAWMTGPGNYRKKFRFTQNKHCVFWYLGFHESFSGKFFLIAQSCWQKLSWFLFIPIEILSRHMFNRCFADKMPIKNLVKI